MKDVLEIKMGLVVIPSKCPRLCLGDMFGRAGLGQCGPRYYDIYELKLVLQADICCNQLFGRNTQLLHRVYDAMIFYCASRLSSALTGHLPALQCETLCLVKLKMTLLIVCAWAPPLLSGFLCFSTR